MSATLPTLPTEIWMKILEKHKTEDNLPELWISLRYVCTAWRDAIEYIFRDSLLRKTHIFFNLGDIYDEELGSVLLDTAFDFSHLSEDKVTAYFKIEDAAEEYRDELRRRLEGAVEMAIERPSAPQHSIQVRHDATDGPIPKLSINYENFPFVLSCDWREMYTMFWGEINLSQKLLSGWADNQRGWAEGLRAQMEGGRLNEMDLITKAMSAFSSTYDSNLKKARRARIKQQWKLRGEDWKFGDDDEDESKALERLTQLRQACDLEVFSDDEQEDDEDEDEDEDGDEDEEKSDGDEKSDEHDEWEDTDEDGVNEEEDSELLD